ncbi:transporter substrate-binding domain-containing protein [Bdellovibrio sp. 22V]|uniref:substrate-binding periplasmic protein n=1 Tax=Bdellovibrio TaxID=958 RepID=UPI002543F47F|nr:transporter substrate-binding domain-containing protein [Bdellovibrio sp. 22V]WII72813.1 transporter substrate-binding domain-containing protein [Bdellovibrio sp. 22V]
MYFILLVLFGLASSGHAAETLRVSYYNFPPEILKTSTGLYGASHEVWEKAAKRAQVKIEWVGPVPYMRALHLLETGKVDAIYRLAKTPEREKVFVFSEVAPFWGKTGIVVLASDRLERVTTDDDIKGKKIGWLRGGTPPPFLEKNRKNIVWEPATDNSIQVNMEKLAQKKIWGAYFIFSSTAYFYNAQNNGPEIKVLPFPGSEKPNRMYAAFSKTANPAIVERMNKAFTAELDGYNYEKLSQKYIDMAAKGLLK